jgi:hypothetical protein
MNLYNPLTVESVWSSFQDAFEGNIEKLRMSHPHLDSEEITERAVEITTQFFYFIESENLPKYMQSDAWRADMV